MNARLYDPRIGRFLSPDSYIPDPENPQSYNRYSYVLNNPLKYVDPTGNYGYIPYQGQYDGTASGFGGSLSFSIGGVTQEMLGMNLWLDIKYYIDLCAFEFYLSAGMMGTFGKYLLDPNGGWGSTYSYKRSITAGVTPTITSGGSLALSGAAKSLVDKLNADLVIKRAAFGFIPYVGQIDKFGCVLATAATIISILGTPSGNPLKYEEIARFWDGLTGGSDWRSKGVNFGDDYFPDLLNYISELTGVTEEKISTREGMSSALNENCIVWGTIETPEGPHSVTGLENSTNQEGLPVVIVWDSGLNSFSAVFSFQFIKVNTVTWKNYDTGNTRIETIFGYKYKRK